MAGLFAALEAALSLDDQTVALITGDRHFTRAELLAGSARYANALADVGVTTGDRIVAQTEKSVPALLAYLACLRLGAVYVPLNTAYTAHEVDFFLGDAQPRVLICDGARRANLQTFALAQGVACTLGIDGDDSLATRAAGAAPERHDPAPPDPAAILYTSGTTGRAKGAMLSQQNLLSNALTLVDLWGCHSGDVLIHALPLYHVHGLFVAMHTALLAGATVQFHERFDAGAVLAALSGATLFMGVPTYYTRLLNEAGLTPAACASIRLFISGSAPLRPETFAAFAARTGHTILERYGMTEAGMITSNPLHGERIAGTVGRPLPGVTARLATDDGGVCATGGPGILQIRGPNVFSGYWRQPDKTATEFTADGYFITGDVAEIDGDGVVTLTGRAKDLIICGGLNVYPKEIELAIDGLPGVEESAVIGVAHPDFGEVVVAVVTALPGATLVPDELTKALRVQLAGFKLPKHVAVVDELPRNAMGKVQKNVLRQRFESLFT